MIRYIDAISVNNAASHAGLNTYILIKIQLRLSTIVGIRDCISMNIYLYIRVSEI